MKALRRCRDQNVLETALHSEELVIKTALKSNFTRLQLREQLSWSHSLVMLREKERAFSLSLPTKIPVHPLYTLHLSHPDSIHQLSSKTLTSLLNRDHSLPHELNQLTKAPKNAEAGSRRSAILSPPPSEAEGC